MLTAQEVADARAAVDEFRDFSRQHGMICASSGVIVALDCEGQLFSRGLTHESTWRRLEGPESA